MKPLMLSLAGTLAIFSLSAQDSNYNLWIRKAVEKAVVEQVSISFDRTKPDSTEIVLLAVLKQNDSLRVEILYHSFKNYTLHIENAINAQPVRKYTETLPDQYACIIPVYFSIETAGGDFRFPTRQQEQAVIHPWISSRNKLKVLEPVKILVFQPARKPSIAYPK